MKILFLLSGPLLTMLIFFPEVPFSPTAQAADISYVGVKTCAKCHKKERSGKQLAIWTKSDHSKAFKTLGTDKAKKSALEQGVKENPQKAEACLVCHTGMVGVDKSLLGKKFSMEDGVQCETCHGAGDGYRKKKIMKKITEERGPHKKRESKTALKTGLLFPDEKSCRVCHAKERKLNGKTFKNPQFKSFDFKERFKKIQHPVPRK